MSVQEQLSGQILGRLPNSLHRLEGDVVPPSLIGARIIQFGTLPNLHPEEGGLAIEYESPDGSHGRVVFGFTELEMWVQALFSQMQMPLDTDRERQPSLRP